MQPDMTCVYYATDIGHADIIVAWLERQGIAAHVKDRLAVGTLPVPALGAPRGVQVCVLDPTYAERATTLLKKHFDEIEQESAAESPGSIIEATCEECGRSSPFPSALRSRVETCPHCGKMMDVPDEAES